MVLKGREGREGNVWCEYGKKERLMGRVANETGDYNTSAKGGHEWTNHERALPAIKLDGNEYSAQRSLTSINQWPGPGMEGLLQQPGMSLHLLA